MKTFRATRWAAITAVLGVVLALFPDVIFMNASFRNSRVGRLFDVTPTARALIPETAGREIWDGYRDYGAAQW